MIEEVDLVGSCTHIGKLVRARGEAGKFDYIVSSRNFEHLPNPIRFLQGCAAARKLRLSDLVALTGLAHKTQVFAPAMPRQIALKMEDHRRVSTGLNSQVRQGSEPMAIAAPVSVLEPARHEQSSSRRYLLANEDPCLSG